MKIVILHFRVGKTDGVSLEIANWKKILENLGHEVLLAGGPESSNADYLLPNLENQLDPEVFFLDEEAFGGFDRISEKDWKKRYLKRQKLLISDFTAMIRKLKPDRLIVSNIFSVGENLAAAGALMKVLEKTGIRTIAINHDFWWENERYDTASCSFVRVELENYFPPILPNIKHCCINTIARKELKKRKGISATLVYDTIDFNLPQIPKKSEAWSHFKSEGVKEDDLVVLQATRIVRRKNIEIAEDFTLEIQKRIKNAVFVISGYAEKRDELYNKTLLQYAKKKGLKMFKVGGFGVIVKNKKHNMCDMMDVYPFAKIVTYPSVKEGFGNQFLEAVFAKKPVVVFEYPVFKSDIKPKGFSYISLGDEIIYKPDGLVKIPDEVMEKAVKETLEILSDENKYTEMVEKNFEIGKKYFSFENTSRVLQKLLQNT